MERTHRKTHILQLELFIYYLVAAVIYKGKTCIFKIKRFFLLTSMFFVCHPNELFETEAEI